MQQNIKVAEEEEGTNYFRMTNNRKKHMSRAQIEERKTQHFA